MKNLFSRRKFLQASAVSASAATLPVAALASIPSISDEVAKKLTQQPFRMKLGFMTSMAQDKNIPQLIDMAKTYGYESIEFRPEWEQAHGVELSMTKSERKSTRTLFADNGITMSAISPGVRFCKDDRDEQLESMYRYIDLAVDLDAYCIRFFADPLPDDPKERYESYKVQAEYQARAAERALEAGIILALETHANSYGKDTGEMMYLAGHPPAFRVNWHLAHCLRGGESTDLAYQHVKGRVVHAHFSYPEDPETMKSLERQFELLLHDGFDGTFSLEIIKKGDNTALLIEHARKWEQMKAKFNV